METLERRHAPIVQSSRPMLRAAVVAAAFFGAIALVSAAVGVARQHFPHADIPPHWPISVFGRQLPFIDASPAVAAHGAVVLAAGVAGLYVLTPRVRGPLAPAAAGVVLLLATNTIQGFQYGLVNPIAGGEIQYYHDAVRIASPGEFIRTFDQAQPHLLSHARVHPPAATLVFWALASAVNHPAAISITIAVLAAAVSAGFLYGALVRRFDRSTAAVTTLVFMVLPAVQVYYCASLDALVTACSAALVYFMLCERPFWGTVGTIGALAAMTSLTFTAVVVLPVVAGLELFMRRRLWRLALVLLGLAEFHVLAGLASGHNWIASFQTASRLENPHGLTIFADPASYAFTRLENVAEIALFLGPFAIAATWRGVRAARRDPRNRDLPAVAALAALSLGGLFALGGWRTGETARSTMFVLPLVMPMIACALAQMPQTRDRARLASLILAQAVAMQTVGRYFW